MPAPLLVADAPHLLYRAFFALPGTIKGSDGQPVNALLGATNLLLQCVELYEPRAVAVCFGAESAAYRTEAYPAYHAHRPPAPDALAAQWGRAAPLWEAFGWAVLDSAEMEADDLMGTLAAREEAEGGEALLLTGDRDMFQCVTERVRVLYPAKGAPEEIGPEEVQERYGVRPDQVADFIALRGDPSDGLPGAKGIGAKTAAELLRRHGTLENALAAAIRERPSIRRALIEQGEQLLMFKRVATLKTVDLPRIQDGATDRAAAADAAAASGMHRLAKRLRGG